MKSKSTQDFVPIKEIRDGVVVLKDNTLRAILLCSSLNFALKSEDEQTALLSQFQHFLNSLDFSIQIYIQSRRLDIRPYIAVLEGHHLKQTNDLIKIQTREYIEFIKNFTESSDIMTKNFFIVVPYEKPILQMGKAGMQIVSFFTKKEKSEDKEGQESMEELETQLEQRISIVEQGLVRMGLRGIRLGTEEVIELLYKIFNPGEMEKPTIPQ